MGRQQSNRNQYLSAACWCGQSRWSALEVVSPIFHYIDHLVMRLGRRSPGSAHRHNRLRPGFRPKLGAVQLLRTHSAVGDGSLVAKEKAFIVDVRTRALELKKQGVDADKAGELLIAECKTKYPDWPNTTVTNLVKSIHAE
jgi:hypothetical protein